jgi:hypothetical protein
MSGRGPSFEWYDAWILCALLIGVHYENPVSLALLIGVADGVNKAMVTRSELEVAFGRLVPAGYVRVVGGMFELTPKAMAFSSLTVGRCTDNIREAIGAGDWAPGLKMPSTETEVYVTREAYRRAEKEYRRRDFWERHKKKSDPTG